MVKNKVVFPFLKKKNKKIRFSAMLLSNTYHMWAKECLFFGTQAKKRKKKIEEIWVERYAEKGEKRFYEVSPSAGPLNLWRVA